MYISDACAHHHLFPYSDLMIGFPPLFFFLYPLPPLSYSESSIFKIENGAAERNLRKRSSCPDEPITRRGRGAQSGIDDAEGSNKRSTSIQLTRGELMGRRKRPTRMTKRAHHLDGGELERETCSAKEA